MAGLAVPPLKSYNFGTESAPTADEPAAMLRVTKLTDYATVVLTALAARPDEVLSAPELADHAGLELPTVAKILKPLAQAGLVAGFRGTNGGYRLARAAETISLFDVVEALEGPLGMTECSVHAGSCGIEQSCGVRANWRRINDVVADALRSVSLAQMLGPLPPATPPRKTIPAVLATA
jgi:FeS assembly SUF system regulator